MRWLEVNALHLARVHPGRLRRQRWSSCSRTSWRLERLEKPRIRPPPALPGARARAESRFLSGALARLDGDRGSSPAWRLDADSTFESRRREHAPFRFIQDRGRAGHVRVSHRRPAWQSAVQDAIPLGRVDGHRPLWVLQGNRTHRDHTSEFPQLKNQLGCDNARKTLQSGGETRTVKGRPAVDLHVTGSTPSVLFGTKEGTASPGSPF